MKSFGEVLRGLRKEKNISMRALAEKLDVSVTYVSDVERGSRAPFAWQKILATALLLGVEPDVLLISAFREKGVIEIPTDGLSSNHMILGANLVLYFHRLGDEALIEVEAILKQH